MKILVINQNANSKFLYYGQQYMLFSEWKPAIAAAKEIGWEDPMGMGINETTGIANIYQCGDVKVTILALDEQ